jgi:hypothetical protein
MAIVLSDNIQANAPKSIDSRYLNNLVPYTSVSAANAAILSGVRFTGLTVNILGTEYWYGTGVLDACLVTKSAGGTWGSITGVLSGQTDLQTCLNGKLASGGTAICATTAGNALCLGGHLPAYYLNTGTTITCAADSAKLNNKLPAYYLNTGSTALCATIAGNSLKLGNNLPAYYLNTGSTITCAADSAKLNNKLPAYYLNTGSTACNSLALCGCIPVCFLGATACACDSKCLGGHLPAYYLNTGTTITCAADSAKLNNKLPAYYLNTGSTALCATTAGNALCLGGVLPAGYLLSGGTAKNSSCLNGHLEAALSVCNSVCVNGHAEAALSVCCAQNSANLGGVLPAGYLLSGGTAKNSLCLGGNLANTYAPIASPNFTTDACAPIVCATTCFKGSGAGLTGTATSLKSNDSSCLNGVLAAGYLLSGGTALCATTAGNALCLGGHTEAALSVCNSVCVNGHAEANLSVANSACLGGHLPAYYLTSGGTALCATTAGNALCLGGSLAACYATKALAITGITSMGTGTTLVHGTPVSGNKIQIKSLKSCGTGLSIVSDATTVGISGSTTDIFANVTDTYLLARNGTNITGVTQTKFAPLASPNFTTCICAPIVCATTCFVGSGAGLTGTAGSLTAGVATTANALCGCVPSCFLGAGATANNSLCLGGNLANTYAPKASPTFTGTITSNDNVNTLSRTAFNNTSVSGSSRADIAITSGTMGIYLGIDCACSLGTPAYLDNRSNGIFGYYYNGASQFVIDTAGKVGIGNTPAYTLDVTGNIAVCGVGNCLTFDTTGARATNSIYTSNDYYLNLFAGRGNTSKIQLTNNNGILFQTNSVQRLQITDAGNLVFGATTHASTSISFPTSTTKTITINTGGPTGTVVFVTAAMYLGAGTGWSYASWIVGGYMDNSGYYTVTTLAAPQNIGTAVISTITKGNGFFSFTMQNAGGVQSGSGVVSVINSSGITSAISIVVT